MSAPVTSRLQSRLVPRAAPVESVNASTGSVTALTGTFGGLSRDGAVGAVLLLAGTITDALAKKACQSSCKMIVRRPIFLARNLPAAIWLYMLERRIGPLFASSLIE
jgi:hypothetical protein